MLQQMDNVIARLAPQNSVSSIWAVGLKQWDIFRKLASVELEEIRSFVVFWSGYSALYITNKDEVCGIGNNGIHLNLLGLSNPYYRKENVEQPVEIKSLSNKGISIICLGVYVGAALDREGWLYWWGCCCENYGEIRTPHLASEAPRYTIVSCGAMFVAALSNDGWVYVWGRLWNSEKYYKEYPLLTNRTVISLACGVGHLAIVTSDGQVYSWGDGRNGQRGDSLYRHPTHDDLVRRVEFEPPCITVKCGGHSTFLLSKSGDIWACGANDHRYGFLGVNFHAPEVTTPLKVCLPEKAIELVAGWKNSLMTSYAALTRNGSVYIWGKTEIPQLVQAVGTSLVAAFIGEPTPRDMMVQVRSPSLVPPTLKKLPFNEAKSRPPEPPKNTKKGDANYISALVNQFHLL